MMMWSDYLRPDPSSPDPLRDLSAMVHRANAERLERQAERMIRHGYRVGEIEIRVATGYAMDPPRLAGRVILIAPCGDVHPRPGGPSEITLAFRRAARMVWPYRPEEDSSENGKNTANASASEDPKKR